MYWLHWLESDILSLIFMCCIWSLPIFLLQHGYPPDVINHGSLYELFCLLQIIGWSQYTCGIVRWPAAWTLIPVWIKKEPPSLIWPSPSTPLNHAMGWIQSSVERSWLCRLGWKQSSDYHWRCRIYPALPDHRFTLLHNTKNREKHEKCVSPGFIGCFRVIKPPVLPGVNKNTFVYEKRKGFLRKAFPLGKVPSAHTGG